MSRRSLLPLLLAAAPAFASPTSSGTGVFYDFTPDTTYTTDERYYDRFAGYYLNEVNQTNPAGPNYLAPVTGPGAPASTAGDFTAMQTQAPGFFMFNYKGTTTDSGFARNDDGYLYVPLKSASVTDSYGKAYSNNLFNPGFKFFGTSWDHYYVNMNGSVSFGAGVSAYTPASFPIAGLPAMIAPFWSDLDSRTRGGQVWFRDASREAGTVNAIAQFIAANKTLALPFVPTSVQIITWDHVAYADSRNYQITTQLVIATDGLRSYALMLYPKNGTQSIIPSSAGGVFPAYGYQDGASNNLNGAGTLTTAMSNLWAGGNTGTDSPGVYLYNVGGLSESFEYHACTADAAQYAAAHGGPGPDGLGGVLLLMGRNNNRATGALLPYRLYSDGYIFYRYNNAPSDTALGADAVLAILRGNTTEANRTGLDPTFDFGFSRIGAMQLSDPAFTVTLALNMTAEFAYAGTFSGGTLRLANNAIVAASAQNAVSGGRVLLTDHAQLWALQHDSLSAAMTLAFDNRYVSGSRGGTGDLHGFNTTVGGLDSLAAGSGMITNTAVTFQVAGDLNVAVSNPLLTVTAEGSHDFSGTIADGAGFVLSLKKSGNGVQRLSGQNTYTGTTLVSAGTLLIGGTHASATTVEAGATLGGSGTISKPVEIRSGAHLAPCDSAGARLTLTAGVTLADGAILDLVLGPANTSLRVSGGALTGPGPGGTVTVKLAAGAGITGGLYTILDATGATISGFEAGNLALSEPLSGYDATFVRTGNNFAVNLVATAVPEPADYGLAGAGLLAGISIVARRRRHRRAARNFA